MSKEFTHHFQLDVDDFDTSLLGTDVPERGTPAFREAVSRFFQDQFAGLSGQARITVGDEIIEVEWSPKRDDGDLLDDAIALLGKRKYSQAIALMTLLLTARPNDVLVLYNMGMALSDSGRLDDAIRLLKQGCELAPDFSDIQVALGVALQRKGKTQDAMSTFRRVVSRSRTIFTPVGIWGRVFWPEGMQKRPSPTSRR
jgi:tetratricopeptide (TPR) repeat protein